MLKATATEKITGLSKSLTIDTKGEHRINLDAARINLAAIFEEEPDKFYFALSSRRCSSITMFTLFEKGELPFSS